MQPPSSDSKPPNEHMKREWSEVSKLTELRLKKKIQMEMDNEQKQQVLRELSQGVSRADPLPSEKVDLKALDEEDHPERKIPDIPENKRVRDFLRSMPLTGHGAAFGKEIRVVQCYRCKCYGHRAGDPECRYTAMGDLGQELQRRVREDPMTCFRKIDCEMPKENPKVARLKALLEEAKREQRSQKSESREQRRGYSSDESDSEENKHQRRRRRSRDEMKESYERKSDLKDERRDSSEIKSDYRENSKSQSQHHHSSRHSRHSSHHHSHSSNRS